MVSSEAESLDGSGSAWSPRTAAVAVIVPGWVVDAATWTVVTAPASSEPRSQVTVPEVSWQVPWSGEADTNAVVGSRASVRETPVAGSDPAFPTVRVYTTSEP